MDPAWQANPEFRRLAPTKKRVVFNALDIRAGGFIHLIFDRKRFAELIEFLEYIVVQYPTAEFT